MKMKITKILPVVLGGVLCIALTEPAWVGKTAQASDSTNKADVVKKYPPYPDVWDWVIPVPQRATQYLQSDIQADGDVRISYKLKSKTLKKQEDDFPEGGSDATTFFGHRMVKAHKNIASYHLQGARQITLASGRVLKSVSKFKATNGCFDRLDSYFVLEDGQGKPLTYKILYYILNKPQHFTVVESCYDGANFTYQVEAVPANLAPLEDGTFLLVDGEHGLVIRFDEEFKTKSSLLNKKVFVFDFNSVPFGVSKDYGSREEGNRDWQRYEDDLYEHLMGMKGRK